MERGALPVPGGSGRFGAEADGNRTRQAGITGLTGFEDREGHQSPVASTKDSRGFAEGEGLHTVSDELVTMSVQDHPKGPLSVTKRTNSVASGVGTFLPIGTRADFFRSERGAK